MSVAEKIQTIAQNEYKIFDAGKKSQYDEFWDDFQQNGERRNYYMTFYSRWNLGTWSDKTFQPKYPIICDGGANCDDVCRAMLYGCYGIRGEIKQAIVIKNTKMDTVFRDLPYVKAIHDLTLENITEVYMPFTYMLNLETLNIKGEIAVNGFDWKDSTKLNHDSIVKIIGVLSTNTSGLTVTLSLTAVNKAFETSVGANNGSTSTEWTNLIATKTNWTIALA